MALPLPKETQVFTSDQRVAFKAYYWNTTTTAIRLGPAFANEEQYTAMGSGLEFALFNLLATAFNPASRTDLETALNNPAVTNPVLGYNISGKYRTGVVPLVYSYWGAGAPPGGGRAKQTLLKYSGYVRKPVPAATLLFAGQGTVHAYVTRVADGTVETIVTGTIKEPEAHIDLSNITPSVIKNDWGYQFNEAPVMLFEGDKIDIYYWHNGEPWGGIACKVYPGAVTTDSDEFLTQLQQAPVLGTSFMAKEAAPLAAAEMSYVQEAELKIDVDAVPELTLTVALAQKGEPTGYRVESFLDEKYLVDNATGASFKKGRAVHFEGGYSKPVSGQELYPRFTGFIEDIWPEDDGLTATLQCRGVASKLTEPFDENTPDRLSYHAFGYIMRELSGEPVFGIPAYDNWHMEMVGQDLCYRAGIDPMTLGLSPVSTSVNYGRWRFFDAKSEQLYYGTRLFAARSLATPEMLIQLERNTNYGNVEPLKQDFLPNDEEYLFRPEVTQRLYDRWKSITDQYGYDFYFNAEGMAVLTARNNPVYFQYMTKSGLYAAGITPGEDQRVAVSAVGGVVFQRRHSDGAWSRVIEGHFSRLDLYVGVGVEAGAGLNGGTINVKVEVNNGLGGWSTALQSVVSTYLNSREGFFYDDFVKRDGTNAAILRLMTLPFDHYRVTLTPGGPVGAEADCVYRLNGVAVFERDPEQTYYTDGQQARGLSTLSNILKLGSDSNYKDLRNHVIVVGSRKATVTDSAKLDGAQDANPNNPEQEFHVAVAADPFSIYDPTSANFVGGKRMTVVFDDKVSDSDFARWLCRTILFRYRFPKASSRFTHTAIPTLELRDALYVTEERHKSVDHMLWVTSFTEKWSLDEATVDITSVAYPELPSYQPREDIDIDTLFPDPVDGVGEPVINVRIGYRNLYGEQVGNADLVNTAVIKGFVTKPPGSGLPMASEAVTWSVAHRLQRPAIPETIYLGWNVSTAGAPYLGTQRKGYTIVQKRGLVNNPYRHFWYISDWDASHHPNLVFTFEEADGTAGVYDKAYYQFPNVGGGQYYVNYDYLPTRSGKNPFYDPYSSVVGNLVSVRFDQLVSGRVRVSVWDANQSGKFETPIAWLTAPGADPEQPEAHFVYLDAGSNKEFVWDGVDNISFWNILNSSEYAQEMKGAFGDKPMTVGKGYYAWNDKTTNLFTLIGDDNPLNFDQDNVPYYTIGQFGQFYVKVEVLNDALARKDAGRLGAPTPRTVSSTRLPKPGAWNPSAAAYIWTHLGEPDKVAIRIQDWVRVGSWTPGTVTQESDWSEYSTPNADATMADGKPVRLTFVPRPRRGPLFTDASDEPDPTLTSVKLIREVHLKATWWDQFWHLSGKPWQGFHKDINTQGQEQKRLVSRMFHNEDHTLSFEDSDYRTGTALQEYEWIFDPTQFKKDFGTGTKERLRYGDYEQIEQLPGFDPKRLGGTSVGERSAMLMAFVNYLFYFSASTLDRSGRRQHCLNSWTDESGKKRGFIDRTKIVTPNWLAASSDPADAAYKPQFIVDYETAGADRYLVRTLFVRQWKEDGWPTGVYEGSPVAAYGITDAHQLKYVQSYVTSFDLNSGWFETGGALDRWLDAFARTGYAAVQYASRYSPRKDNQDTKAVIEIGANRNFCPTSFGTWDFDRLGLTGYFKPNPCRDFHPFWRYPFMPDAAMAYSWPYRDSDSLAQGYLQIHESVASNIRSPIRDHAAREMWYGYAFSEEFADDIASDFGPEAEGWAKDWFHGVRVEKLTEELGAQEPRDVGHDDNVTGFGDRAWPSGQAAALFDYTKQDELDRFDQFRGIISRGPYADRTADADTTLTGSDKARSAAAQPVKASGVYLTNLGRYTEGYTVGPAHTRVPDVNIHFTDKVEDWFALRFPHEYVWYSPLYFPVTREGGAVYGYTRSEYTGAAKIVGRPWWAFDAHKVLFEPTQLFYDAGAWAGWKWDLSSATWSGDPHLRWREINSLATETVLSDKLVFGCGGHGAPFADTPTGLATDTTDWLYTPYYSLQQILFNGAPFKRIPLFDEYYSRTTLMRLATGPEIPEARTMIMNLVLPANLRA